MLSFISVAIRKAPLLTGSVFVALGQAVSAAMSFKFPKAVPLEMADVNSLGLSSFLTILFYAHSAGSTRQKVLAAAVLAWAGRLSIFLAGRVRKGFHDTRLDKFRGSARGARAWCAAQTTWISVILLPVWVGMSANAGQPAFNFLDGICAAAAAGGLIIANVADKQKAAFLEENAKRPEAERGPFCDVGLFRKSRFPNYFGEWLMWAAVSVSAFQTKTSWARFFLPICPYMVLQIFYKVLMPLGFKSVRKRATKEQLEEWLQISEFVPRP